MSVPIDLHIAYDTKSPAGSRAQLLVVTKAQKGCGGHLDVSHAHTIFFANASAKNFGDSGDDEVFGNERKKKKTMAVL